jgi:small conductance mechanosensitive channel
MQAVIRWGLVLGLFAAPVLAQGAEDLGKLDLKTLTERSRTAYEALNTAIADRDAKQAAFQGSGKDEDKAARDAAQKGVNAALETLKAHRDALEAKLGGEGIDEGDADVVEARALLGEVKTAILGEAGLSLDTIDAEAALGLAQKWLNKAKDWVVNDGPGVLLAIFKFLAILLVFKWLASFAGKLVERAIKTARLKISDLLRNFFVNVTTKVIFFVGIMIALQSIDVPIGPLLAGVGVLGFVVGFALQDTLGNFASGIMILLYRPFDVGNVVSVAGMTGKVDAMTLVSTTLVLPDNQVVMIPNNKIWGDTITNITARPTRRVDMTFGVGYGDDLDKAEKVLMDVVTKHEKVLADPAPTIRVTALADSSVNFVVRPWAKTADYWEVYWDLHKQIKQRLDAEGINIPFPQRDVHIYEERVNR